MAARVLLVDNHDSYTGNLLQLLWCETGSRPDLVESDSMDVDRLAALDYSHIVLGPGPGTPLHARDVGGSYRLLAQTTVPVLGVCFGMQTFAVALGADIARLPHPAHGRVSALRTAPSPLFRDVESGTPVVRYHSLHIAEPLPRPLRATAWAEDGTLMGCDAPDLALYGVQFHPESIGTPAGARMIRNFLAQDAIADRRTMAREAAHA